MKHIFREKDGKIYNSYKFFSINLPYNTTILIACVIIGLLNKNVTKAIFTGTVLYIWAYIIHVIAHKIPPFTFFHGFHHDDTINKTWWAEIIETLVNIFGSGGLSLAIIGLIIEKKIGLSIFDSHVLLFTTFLYTSFHMINYHILKVPTHVNHHKDPNKNYGPDIMDILFSSKMDGDSFEDMNHGIVNALVITSFILFTYNTKYDIIAIIKKVIDKFL